MTHIKGFLVCFLSLSLISCPLTVLATENLLRDPKNITYLHTVRLENSERWREKYESQIRNGQTIPSEWLFENNFGIWLKEVGSNSLSKTPYFGAENGLYRHAYYQDYAGSTYPILVAIKLDQILWYSGSTEEERTWTEWLSKNRRTKNNFPKKVVEKLKSLKLPHHSQFYQTHKFAGIYNGFYVLLNPKEVSEVLLFIPENRGSENIERIYRSLKGSRCGEAHLLSIK